jgi:hypothetical protein
MMNRQAAEIAKKIEAVNCQIGDAVAARVNSNAFFFLANFASWRLNFFFENR